MYYMAFAYNNGKEAVLQLVLLVLLASTLAMAMANKDMANWNWRPYRPDRNATQPKKVVVGGSDNWHFGFNYTDWALKNGPFYIGDTLVFKYDPPNDTTFPHSVYLLPNYWSFVKCDLRWAWKIADPTKGTGDGFEFVLRRWQPYYFACGERNGFHCRNGTMKFPVMPLMHYWN